MKYININNISMKKVIILIISIITSLSLLLQVNASNLEEVLYKNVIVTKNQIEKDYTNGKALNTRIAEIFIKYRWDKDKINLEKLKDLLKWKIIILENKDRITNNEKKVLNLYKNLFFRAVLLTDYNI